MTDNLLQHIVHYVPETAQPSSFREPLLKSIFTVNIHAEENKLSEKSYSYKFKDALAESNVFFKHDLAIQLPKSDVKEISSKFILINQKTFKHAIYSSDFVLRNCDMILSQQDLVNTLHYFDELNDRTRVIPRHYTEKFTLYENLEHIKLAYAMNAKPLDMIFTEMESVNAVFATFFYVQARSGNFYNLAHYLADSFDFHALCHLLGYDCGKWLFDAGKFKTCMNSNS